MRLALYLALLLPHKPLGIPWPADLKQATHYGCRADRVPGAEPPDTWWHVYVLLDFPGRHWQHRISIRPGNERAKALQDCDKALSEYERALKRAQ